MNALRGVAPDITAGVANGAGPAIVRIVLLLPEGLLRSGLQSSLASESGFTVVGATADQDAAVALAVEGSAHIVLGETGGDPAGAPGLVGALAAAGCAARVVELAQRPDEAGVRRAMLAGVRGYLAREDGYAQLLESLRAVARGARALGDAVESLVLASYVVRVVARHGSGNAPITSREREVLAQIGQGYANKQIARGLRLSVKTVEKHRSNLMRKLGLHNAAAVAAYAIRQGLVNR